MDSVLHLVGIAKKAGKLELGEEPVGASARAKQARVILLAADAAENSVRRAGHYAEAGNTLCLRTPYTKAELGSTVGRASCAMMAVTDAGLASSMAAKLAAAAPEVYGEAAEKLQLKAAKVLKRQKEQRQHEKNLQKHKAKPWAAPGGKMGAEARLARKEPGADQPRRPSGVAKPKHPSRGAKPAGRPSRAPSKRSTAEPAK